MKDNKQNSIYLIINQFAGVGSGKKVVKIVVPFLQEKGYLVEYSFSEKPGHSVLLAQEAVQKGFGIVVATGGDGTVNEVAQGLIGTGIPLGIIPTGSGNGLAHELHIPLNIIKAAEILISGNNFRIDVFKIQQQIFLCTCGLGFDAHIAGKMKMQSKRGFLRYLQLVILERWRYKPIELKLKINGQIENREVFMLTFANASQFGNNAYIAPGASISDGLMDVVLVKPFTVIFYPLLGIALFTRRIQFLPFIERFRVSEFLVESGNTAIFHFDGDLGRITFPLTVLPDPRELLVRVPQGIK